MSHGIIDDALVLVRRIQGDQYLYMDFGDAPLKTVVCKNLFAISPPLLTAAVILQGEILTHSNDGIQNTQHIERKREKETDTVEK